VEGDRIAVFDYVDSLGGSPFERWFGSLNSRAAAKVTVGLYKLEQGNFSNVEGVGAGVFEYKIDFGPGYRIYFGKDGECVIILLGGSGKKRQSTAIAAAQAAWAAYKEDKTHKKPRQEEG
jgi:putative addiction module killer protein